MSGTHLCKARLCCHGVYEPHTCKAHLPLLKGLHGLKSFIEQAFHPETPFSNVFVQCLDKCSFRADSRFLTSCTEGLHQAYSIIEGQQEKGPPQLTVHHPSKPFQERAHWFFPYSNDGLPGLWGVDLGTLLYLFSQWRTYSFSKR